MKATGGGRRGTLAAAGLLSIATFGGVLATGLLSNSLALR